MKNIKTSYVRNIVFGAEDSLVSTVGVLFGVATAYTSTSQILLTGLIIIFVEALSMGVGSFLSETSAEELDAKSAKRENPIIDGILMFVSYFISGFIVLAPYVLINGSSAKYVSLLTTLVALLLLGYLPAKNPKSAIRMAILGSLAVIAGFLVANVFSPTLG